MRVFKKFPTKIQLNSQDCGFTCIRIISAYYKVEISHSNNMFKGTEIMKQGVSVMNLSEVAQLVGFNALVVKLDYEAMCKHVILPAIFFWDQNHFVVVYKIKNDKIYVSDPSIGRVVYTKQEFEFRWKQENDGGIILLLEPTENLYENRDFIQKDRKSFRNIVQYLNLHKPQLYIITLTLIVSSGIELIFPFFTQKIIDKGVLRKDTSFIYMVLVAQITVFASRISLEFYRTWIFIHISSRVSMSIISDFLIKLMRLPLKNFNSKNIGDFTQRIQDHKRIEAFVSKDLIQALFAFFNIVIYLMVLVYFNINIFFVVLSLSVFQVLWILSFMEKIRVMDRKFFSLNAMDQNRIYELITSMQEVKLNNLENNKLRAWQELQKRIYRIVLEKTKLDQKYEGYKFVSFFQTILVVFVASFAVIEGRLTIGTMLAIMFILGGLNGPTTQFINFILQYQLVRVSYERLSEFHSEEEENSNHNLLETEDLGNLVLENVSFSYSNKLDVLKNINLSIPKGKTTAIVGVSGSGKTSLLKLFLKFHQPRKGTVFIGAYPIEHVENSYWRAKCGVILQDSFIFSDTIAYNIALDTKYDVEKLENALKLANIDSFVGQLELKAETIIGMEGVGLSQGQKQRILIARAIYKNPDYLFFDEATNSLDTENEKMIVDSISSFFKNKTIVIVAHRLSTVKNADQIVVLDRGIIIEKGTHQSLLESRGKYYDLIKNQLEQ